jgi:coatomer subunit beta
VDEYRQLLVRALHSIGVRFPEAATAIVPQLMEFLCDSSGACVGCLRFDRSRVALDGFLKQVLTDALIHYWLTPLPASDVILFVREAFERMPQLRSDMLAKLLENFGQIRNGKVSRATLWIIGEYAATAADIRSAIKHIRLGAILEP